eukprot:COSAG02_NODE_557_length_20379_cov_6.688215_13_plen_101_part_00
MTMWIATQTSRFKAAVSHAGLSNHISFYVRWDTRSGSSAGNRCSQRDPSLFLWCHIHDVPVALAEALRSKTWLYSNWWNDTLARMYAGHFDVPASMRVRI